MCVQQVAPTSKSAVSRISESADWKSPATVELSGPVADLEIGDTAGLETCTTKEWA